MATLIRRSEALKALNRLEEKAREAEDTEGVKWIVKCFNAIMSCKVENKIFCNECGKMIRKKDSEGGS